MSSPSDRSRDQVRRHWQRRGVEESSDSRTSSDYSDMNETAEEGGQGDEYELKEVKIEQPNGTGHTHKKKLWEAKGKRSRMKRILSTKHDIKKRRKSQILEAHVRMHLFRKRKTREGMELPFYQQNLPVGTDWSCKDGLAEDSAIFLILPLTMVHVIDENSPLYETHPKDLLNCDFEIVVLLEGTVEATSMLVQAKTSYTSDEILWGHEFVNTTDEFRWKSGRYRVDFSVFDNTRAVPTPQVSAKDYYEGKMFKMNSESSLLSVGTQEDLSYDSDNTGQRPAETTLSIEDNEANAEIISVAYV
ncbi:ATP-sensitive inward rectifier potassium channel 12 [Stylophora pistillata]|uniref:ATP-sensitive inward rectifier potassium channel 12 n=1 Tax=Stylophora pistillata TaxID=50429 RepID=A0A2B4SMC1_STYPI|nr:ATP-sensitive inward rectifier potassium channel 12 [Stylophora pistillata]